MMRGRLRCGVTVLALMAAVALWPSGAAADHSLKRPCLNCHSLRSTRIVTNSRNIDCEQLAADPLYGWSWDGSACNPTGSVWYCGTRWLPGAAATGGDPVDCSFCHGQTGDIGDEIKNAATTSGSNHPVTVRADGGKTYLPTRIRCNDCHNADLESDPADPCTKIEGTTGYPNHQNLLGSTPAGFDPGTNRRIGLAAHLDLGTNYKYGLKYGTTVDGVDWSGDLTASGNIPVCFSCHRSGGSAGTNIQDEYTAEGGGHNLTGVGNPALDGRRLGCFDCHDSHASGNKSLIVYGDDAIVNPYQTTYYAAGNNPPDSPGIATVFDGSNDRIVCAGCHDNGYRYDPTGLANGNHTDEVTITDVVGGTFTPKFPFHADAHAGVASAGNCLQKNGGCHQGAHNTDIYACLDCHSTGITPAPTNTRLLAVNHVDDAFGHVGNAALGIKSQHNIPYDVTGATDMRVAANNGCLYCHDTRGLAANTIVAGPGGAGATTGHRGNALNTRAALNLFDPFCLSCHDGSGAAFQIGTNTYEPPRVDLYFANFGHGLSAGSYDNGIATAGGGGNPAAGIPCLECHLYHGSSAYKLLPGDALAGVSGVAQVVKGYPYVPVTTGVKFPIGDSKDSRKIDYADYTRPQSAADNPAPRYYNNRLSRDDLRAGYLSDYTSAWSSYSIGTGNQSSPNGTWTPFGTSGDVRVNGGNYSRSLDCGQDARDTYLNVNDPDGTKIGFCNACHLYNNSTDGTTAPTPGPGTYGKAYSHEGWVNSGNVDCSNNPLNSNHTFFKDCGECHDPHGSGTDNGGRSGRNLFMIRGKVKNVTTRNETDAEGTNAWTRVVFQRRGDPPGQATPDPSLAADSHDEDQGSNSDDLCNVCHDGLRWSNLNQAQDTQQHFLGKRCVVCHSHGQ